MSDPSEPNWLDQAEEQMSALWATLDEISDPTCLEAWEALEAAISAHRSSQNIFAENIDDMFRTPTPEANHG